MSWTTSRGVIALVAVAALTLLAGCGGSDDLADDGSSTSASASDAASESPSASPSESSSSPTESTSESADAESLAAEAVEADYRQYMAAYLTAYRARDAKVAKLIEYSTPSRQAKHRLDVSQMRQTGFRLKGTPKVSMRRVIIEGNRATMRICEWDKAAWFEDANGNLLAPVKARWVPQTVQLIERDGHWKVNKETDSKFSCKGAS